jgi:hypothetical protein
MELQRTERTVNYPNISSALRPVPHAEDLPVPVPSAIRPVPHTEDLPVPLPPQQYILDSDDEPTENRERHLQHLRMLILLMIFNLTNSIELHKRN